MRICYAERAPRSVCRRLLRGRWLRPEFSKRNANVDRACMYARRRRRREDDKEEKKYGSARVESLFGALFHFFFDVSASSFIFIFFDSDSDWRMQKTNGWEVLEETLTGCASRGGSVAQVHHSAREDRTCFSRSTRSDSLLSW